MKKPPLKVNITIQGPLASGKTRLAQALAATIEQVTGVKTLISSDSGALTDAKGHSCTEYWARQNYGTFHVIKEKVKPV